MTYRFDAVMEKSKEQDGWTYLLWPESSVQLGTGKAVKVKGMLDDVPFEATLLPWGDGSHMLPLRAALRKALSKGPGDRVSVALAKRDA